VELNQNKANTSTATLHFCTWGDVILAQGRVEYIAKNPYLKFESWDFSSLGFEVQEDIVIRELIYKYC
jgi:hypothetical protein